MKEKLKSALSQKQLLKILSETDTEISDQVVGDVHTIDVNMMAAINDAEQHLKSSLVDIFHEKPVEVLDAFSELDRSSAEHFEYDFFYMVSFYEAILEKGVYQVEPVIDVSVKLFDQMAGDVSQFVLVAKSGRFCANQQESGLTNAIDYSLDKRGSYLSFVSAFISHLFLIAPERARDYIQKLLSTSDPKLSSIALSSVSSACELYRPNEIISIVEMFKGDQFHMLIPELINILLNIWNSSGEFEKDIERLLIEFVSYQQPKVFQTCVSFLYFSANKLNVDQCLVLLWEIVQFPNEAFGSSLSGLSGVLASLFDLRPIKVIFIVELLLTVNNNNVDLLKSCHQLIEKLRSRKDVSYHLLCHWLTSANPALCQSFYLLFRPTQLQQNIWSKSIWLEDEQLAFVARKVIAYFLLDSEPSKGCWILLRLIETTDTPETKVYIANLIYRYLFLNYPATINEYVLSEKGNIDDDYVEDLISAFTEYFSGFEGALPLLELQPTYRERNILERHQSELRQSVRDELPESPLEKLFPTSQVLYGNESVAYLLVPEGHEKVRQNHPMIVNNYSIEIPRMTIVDPIELEYTMKSFKLEGLL